jgi:carbonic anhydrase
MSLCTTGKKQSPISINPQEVTPCDNIENCKLSFCYKNSVGTISNLNDTIFIEWDTGSYVNWNSIVYQLQRISFSNPQHDIEGEWDIDPKSHVEMFLWHRTYDNSTPFKNLVISVLVEQQDRPTPSAGFFSYALETRTLPQHGKVDFDTPSSWNIYNALPENKAFYQYEGSLLAKPCTENVIWIIMENEVVMGSNPFKIITKLINLNAKPPKYKKINKRHILYSTNSEKSTNQNYGVGLKCYTDEELRKTCQCMCKSNQKIPLIPSLNSPTVLIMFIITLFILFIIISSNMGFFTPINQSLSELISPSRLVLEKVS